MNILLKILAGEVEATTILVCGELPDGGGGWRVCRGQGGDVSKIVRRGGGILCREVGGGKRWCL